MSDTAEALSSLLEQLQARAAARLPAEERTAFLQFLRPYFEMTSPDTLSLRSPDELLDIAIGHWRFARQRRPGTALLRISPPVDPGASGSRGLAQLETVNDDMPFLVDSISMAVRDAGGGIDWSVHPVLTVVRDGGGRLDRVVAAGITDAAPSRTSQESLIHLQFEPLAQPQDYAQLEANLQQLLGDLRRVVEDFAPIRAQLRALEVLLQAPPSAADAAEFAEAREFLQWLDQGHFTFLGYVEADAVADAQGRAGFVTRTAASLGLARPGARLSDSDQLLAPREELDKYRESPRVIVITKGNHRSTVHHPEFVDVVSVKRFAADGTVQGTSRFIGLFATDAYTERPRNIPLIRRKAEYVIQRSRLPEQSHSGKRLREILHQLPRDELFQSSEEELFETCTGIRALRDRHQLRLFMRRDRYGRFYSCLVFLPRDRYSRERRDRIAAELLAVCGGLDVDRHTEFLRDGLARLQYRVRTPPGTRVEMPLATIEARLIAATRSWREQLREALHGGTQPDRIAAATRLLDAFPLSYQESTAAAAAVEDLHLLAPLSRQQPLLLRLMTEAGDSDRPDALALKLYAWSQPLPLSDVLPALENFGLRVLTQDLVEIRARDGESLWIQQFQVQIGGDSQALASSRSRFEAAFLGTWRGETENDGLNRLVLLAGLDARQVVCLRTLTKYLIQTGLPYSQDYMERLLAQHATIAQLLLQLFEARFDPQRDRAQSDVQQQQLSEALAQQLDAVVTLDGDRVLRAYVAVVQATLRTNFYQPDAQGADKPYVSIKLDPRKVPELPAPLPMFEIFVYAPEVEGIHLRGGRVARGGLRWSDRRQDFRTEVLGLMKAQTVKNAIIVPVGAKGGFVVKRSDPGQREIWMQQGIACYQIFLRGLLDLTDNRRGEQIVPPPHLVRHDEDDPYLVVAADKGTATFSDTANAVAAEYGFWMGDAFASGGSVGYDHKKMGITARGAWDSVRRHFRELTGSGRADDVGIDIQREPFTVVGIGDMSGDVFGNGMLLSPQIRLLAAFDHRHIFIDPAPDAALSHAERQRLFRLPRSSWDDYDRSKLSPGGSISPRSAKLIQLSVEAQQALALPKASMTPQELIKAMLRAPVDLLWNGGIGTYVKGHHQSHQECGDRANDAIRIDGRELRCKVVGEGGNLGFTQLGRIEAALHGNGGRGVRLNADFIDNAGGVHSSDREVNIKIPLNQLLAEQVLRREVRDPLLAQLTEAVSSSVLRDNYRQSLAVSLMEGDAVARLDEHGNLMRTLERDGLLSRAVEYLPDDEGLKERRAQGKGLTRPELAVLLSYSKISLYDSLLQSRVPDDSHFESELLAYFPSRLVEQYRSALQHHRLRREIVATILANAVINRMSAAFVHRYAEDHGVARADVVKAYAMADDIHQAQDHWLQIQALDGQVPAELQRRLYARVAGLMKHAAIWLLNNRWAEREIGDAVQTFRAPVAQLGGLLPEVLPPAYRADWDKAAAVMREAGVPPALAVQLANTLVLGSAPDIVELATTANVSLSEAAAVYFLIGERLRVLWLLSAIVGLQAKGKWQALARGNLREDTYRLHRQLVARVLEFPGASAEARIEAWSQAGQARVQFGMLRMQQLQTAATHDFETLALGVRELRKLRLL
jgi:glutamate dehydrogenase